MLSLAGVGREDMALMLADLGCRQVGEKPAEDPEKPAIAQFERVQKKRSAKPKHKQSGPPRGGKAKPSSRTGQNQNRAPRARAEKQPDPNSPFAVLAALKK